MKLIEDIRADLVNEKAGLSNTLRKAKILAKQLGVVEFQQWVRSELEGYEVPARAPSYRKSRPTNYGTFSGPFQTGAKNVVLPTYNLQDPVKEFAENLILAQGIGELEAMLQSSDKTFHRRWPQELIILARDAIAMTGDMVLVDADQPIPRHLVAGILDSVKNRLLDFLLELETLDISENDNSINSPIPEKVRNLFNINIYGSNNVVASGDQVNQTSIIVKKGDVESALQQLRSLDIPEIDLKDLRKAIATDKVPEKGKLGPQVGSWLGRMVSKAASGTWKVALEVAPNLIMQVLKAYYGWQ